MWPVILGEIMDISVKTIELDRSGADGLICRDNIRADIKITFFEPSSPSNRRSRAPRCRLSVPTAVCPPSGNQEENP